MLSGLAGITPASGFVRPYYGLPSFSYSFLLLLFLSRSDWNYLLLVGILLGFCSFFGAKLVKEKLKVDDALVLFFLFLSFSFSR